MVVRRNEVEMRVLDASEVKIKGVHNLQNAMAASLAAFEMGIPLASIADTLRSFPGVEHRLEPVREIGGISFVNDSKATNVDSVWYALQSFTSPIILLLGGREKGNDYERLVPLVRQHVRSIVAIGESADKVTNAFSAIVPVRTAQSMGEAVRLASGGAQRGDIVLLSPACASFDWFQNYEHRGRAFKEEVMKL
jgi:UDP-N-acetylmuramoylalanine--D-glutamate ligase